MSTDFSLSTYYLYWTVTAQSTTRSCRASQLIVALFLGRFSWAYLMLLLFQSSGVVFLQSRFNIPVPWHLFDTVVKVISWPTFVSRCITDAYFSFYGLVLDIDMNHGCRLYCPFHQMDLTYAMDCLFNSIIGVNVTFLLTIWPPYTQQWLSRTD